MSGILPDQDTTADNADENVDWHWRLSRAGSDLIKGERVRTYGVRARVGSIEYLPGIDFGLIASAIEGITLDVVSSSSFFFELEKSLGLSSMLHIRIFFTRL